MDAVMLGVAVARECPDCTGLWIDTEAFDRICGDREQHSSILGAAGAAPAPRHDGLRPKDVRYLHCPACNALMNRVNFAKISGVVMDVCKHDGVWLDAGELQRIIGFIDGGGLEASRTRERERLVEEQHRLEALKGTSSPREASWQSTMTMRHGEPRDSAVDVVHLLSTVINFTKR
jgi:Zn-finger nucleic acid-binding protein